MLTKEIGTQVTVLEDGQLQVKEVTRIIEDGVVISSSNHRRVVAPDDDTSLETGHVKKAADAFHDAETIAKYKEKKAKQNGPK